MPSEPYTPTEADVQQIATEFYRRDHGQNATMPEFHPYYFAMAEAVLSLDWLAGERHRAVEATAARIEAELAETAAAGIDLGGDYLRGMRSAIRQFRAAFPAVGGSTPAVDGEGGTVPANVKPEGSKS